jgi:hypothetical protein
LGLASCTAKAFARQSKIDKKVKSRLSNVHQIRFEVGRRYRLPTENTSLIKKPQKSSTCMRNIMQTHTNKALTLRCDPFRLAL